MRPNSSDLPDLFGELPELPAAGAEGAQTDALPAEGTKESETATPEGAVGADDDKRSEDVSERPRRRSKTTNRPKRTNKPGTGEEAQEPNGPRLEPSDTAPGVTLGEAISTVATDSGRELTVAGTASSILVAAAFGPRLPTSAGGTPSISNDGTYSEVVSARQRARRETNKQLKRQRREKEVPKPKEPDRLIPLPRYLSVEQVAENIGVSEQTIWRWVGEVSDFPKPLKIGKATRFLADELDSYVLKQAQSRS